MIIKPVEETQSRKLKDEWVALMLIAKQIGLTPDEVRKFIRDQMC